MNIPKVSIIGRPNVGKSTLFNRIAKRKIAIVENLPGVTRDRIEKEIIWNNKKFILVDTGGMDISPKKNGEIQYSSPQIIKLVQKQINIALQESEIIIFLLDVKSGILPDDKDIADCLRRSGKKIFVVVNKCDNEKLQTKSLQFYELGFEKLFPISAINGFGIRELLDEITCCFAENIQEENNIEPIKIAIIGRPNVGKSSIINAILKEERLLVDAKPGTTRDSIDIKFQTDETQFVLIDTAGIRKRKKIKDNIEYYSVVRTKKTIERCDIVVLVIDAVLGVSDQDKKIAGDAKEKNKAMIIAVNKWDLVMGRKKQPGQKKIIHDYISAIKREFFFCNYSPIIFISAKTQHRIDEILPTCKEVFQNYIKKISTPELNNFLQKTINEFQVPSAQNVKIYYATQIDIKPPAFIFFVKYKEDAIEENYIKFIERKLRQKFLYTGVPIKILFRNKR